jgi:type I restriction enzyme S subunit
MVDGVEYELNDVVDLKSGTTVSNKLERVTGDVAYIKVSGMNLEGNEIKITNSNMFLNYEDINVNHILPIGTTIFPKRGGAIATNKKRITDIPLCIDLNTMGAIPKPEIVLPQYILLL